MLKKLKSIIDGWKNSIIPNKELSELFQMRFDACMNCEMNKFNVCSICLCPVVSKSKSLAEECPHPDGSRWPPIPRYDEQGKYRRRDELPINLQSYFPN